jgi:hypothetical protein
VLPLARGGVGEEVGGRGAPERGVGGEEVRQVLADGRVVAGDKLVGEKRADEERLPAERELALIVDRRAFDFLAGDFELRVVEENFEFATGAHRARGAQCEGLGGHAAEHAAQRRHAGGSEAAEPFAELGLVGEAFDAEGALEAVVGLQPLGVGQAHPAAAQRDDDLRGHDLGRVAALFVRARIERGLGAEEFPQAEPFAERGHGHLTAMHRVAVGRDKFNAQFGIVEGVERHVAASRRSTPHSRCTPASP